MHGEQRQQDAATTQLDVVRLIAHLALGAMFAGNRWFIRDDLILILPVAVTIVALELRSLVTRQPATLVHRLVLIGWSALFLTGLVSRVGAGLDQWLQANATRHTTTPDAEVSVIGDSDYSFSWTDRVGPGFPAAVMVAAALATWLVHLLPRRGIAIVQPLFSIAVVALVAWQALNWGR